MRPCDDAHVGSMPAPRRNGQARPRPDLTLAAAAPRLRAWINRACSSGLNAIAVAARNIVEDGMDIMVGAGVDSITYQGGGGGGKDDTLTQISPDFWMPMIDTADVVAARYNLSREYQDEYSLRSQRLKTPQ